MTAVQFTLTKAGADGAPVPITPGDYAVRSLEETASCMTTNSCPTGALAIFLRQNDVCENPYTGPVVHFGVSGRVVLDAYEPGKAVKGSFEITFGDQRETRKGAFDATACPMRSAEGVVSCTDV